MCCSTKSQIIHLFFFTYLTTIDSPLVKIIIPSQQKHGSVSHLEWTEVTTSAVFVTAATSRCNMHIYWSTPVISKSAKSWAALQTYALSANQSQATMNTAVPFEAQGAQSWSCTEFIRRRHPFPPQPLSEVHTVQNNHQICKHGLTHTHARASIGVYLYINADHTQRPLPVREEIVRFYASVYFW